MTVKARMRCHAVKTNTYLDQPGGKEVVGSKEVRLSPVCSNNPADPNYSYSQATPAGEVYLFVTNPAAYDQFVNGKVYDITFEEYTASADDPPSDRAA